MSDPVPAIIESEATGEIAAIFADIRAVYRVGVVNLIWRHLATMPGALPWAWAALRPIYVDGLVAKAAATLHAGLVLPAVPPVPAPVFAALGLAAPDMASIRAILAAYDRTNAMALVALSALDAALAGHPAGAATGSHSSMEQPADIPLPRLLTLDEMAPATADLVLRLNRFGSRVEAPILASMYRHLAHWPSYLALSWAVLAPLDADRPLADATDAVIAQVRAIRPPITTTSLPDAVRPQVAQALAAFTGDVIARMVVNCALLRQITGA